MIDCWYLKITVVIHYNAFHSIYALLVPLGGTHLGRIHIHHLKSLPYNFPHKGIVGSSDRNEQTKYNSRVANNNEIIIKMLYRYMIHDAYHICEPRNLAMRSICFSKTQGMNLLEGSGQTLYL